MTIAKLVEFSSPELQLGKLYERMRRLPELESLNGEAFRRLERDVPAAPDGPLTAVTLVTRITGPAWREVQYIWRWVAEQMPATVYPSVIMDDGHMRLAPGLGPVEAATASWEVIDFGANRGRSPDQVLEGTVPSPLAALSGIDMHPKMALSMNGETIPYIWEASVECTVPGDDPWRRALFVRFVRGARQARLGASWRGYANSDWAVPAPPAV